jgi:hypothetical protein
MVKIWIPQGNGQYMIATMINSMSDSGTGSSVFTPFYHEAYALGYGPQVHTHQGQVNTSAGIVQRNNLHRNPNNNPALNGFAS